MSAWLIALTGVIYLCVAGEQLLAGRVPMAVVYFGYAFSNIGLYILASK